MNFVKVWFSKIQFSNFIPLYEWESPSNSICSNQLLFFKNYLFNIYDTSIIKSTGTKGANKIIS